MILAVHMGDAAEALADAPKWMRRETYVMGGVASSAACALVQVMVAVLAFSSEVSGIIIGVALTAGVALAASLTRLIRLSIAIAELWLKNKLEELSDKADVHFGEAEEIADQ